jgi:hypothetical protein
MYNYNDPNLDLSIDYEQTKIIKTSYDNFNIDFNIDDFNNYWNKLLNSNSYNNNISFNISNLIYNNTLSISNIYTDTNNEFIFSKIIDQPIYFCNKLYSIDNMLNNHIYNSHNNTFSLYYYFL